jgi:hypothetical protein
MNWRHGPDGPEGEKPAWFGGLSGEDFESEEVLYVVIDVDEILITQ